MCLRFHVSLVSAIAIAIAIAIEERNKRAIAFVPVLPPLPSHFVLKLDTFPFNGKCQRLLATPHAFPFVTLFLLSIDMLASTEVVRIIAIKAETTNILSNIVLQQIRALLHFIKIWLHYQKSLICRALFLRPQRFVQSYALGCNCKVCYRFLLERLAHPEVTVTATVTGV